MLRVIFKASSPTSRGTLRSSPTGRAYERRSLWVRRLVVRFSPRRSGFVSGSVYMEFLVAGVTQTGFSPSTLVFPRQYYCTIAPYLSIHLPPTLYSVFLPALQFSPVSIIPPLLHTHVFIYHPHCIIFFSVLQFSPVSIPKNDTS